MPKGEYDWRIEEIMKMGSERGVHITPEEASGMVSSGQVQFGLPEDYLTQTVEEPTNTKNKKPRRFGENSNAEPDNNTS